MKEVIEPDFGFFYKNLIHSCVLFLLEYDIMNSLISGKNIVLDLWSKNF